MTTAEFIIGRSADDAAERKQEVRKIFWALLAALAIHLIIGYSLAVFGGLLSTPFSVTEDEKPVELTFVDLQSSVPVPTPTPAVPEIRMEDLKDSAVAPRDASFHSNINSVAASELPASGQIAQPSQEGKKSDEMELEAHDSSLAMRGAQAQPSAEPNRTPQPALAPQSASPQPSTSEAERFAMLTSTPTPTIEPSVAPKSAPHQSSSYRSFKEKTRISGSIDNRGTSSVDAVRTPLAAYRKNLLAAIGARWYPFVDSKSDLVAVGTLKMHFYIDQNGRVKDLKIIENTSNETFANVCLRAVLDAQFPPIPPDVAAALPPEGLEFEELTFIQL